MKRNRIALILALAAATVMPAAFAEDTAAQEPWIEAAPSGWVAASLYIRPWDDNAFAAAGLRGSFALDGTAFGSVGFKLALDGYTNLAGLDASCDWQVRQPVWLEAQLWGNDRLSGSLELKEGWFDFSVGAVDVRIGQQVLAWGLADGSNPTDNLNARRVGTRFVSTLDEQKIGTLAANAIWNLPDNLGSVQGLFMPLSTANQLPSLAMTVNAGTATIKIGEDANPPIAPENFEGGGRALLYLGAVTTSVSYLTYLDRYPDFAIASSFTPPSTVTITMAPTHNRIHQAGVDAAIMLAGFDLRTEWALSLTEDMEGVDPAVKNPYLSGVLQVSRSLFDGTLTPSLAWAPRYVFNHRMPADYSDAGDRQTATYLREYDGQAYAFENVLTARVSLKFLNETLQPEAMFLAELAARDWLATVSATYNLADGLNLKAGASFYGTFLADGDPDIAYGTFSNSRTIDHDNFFVELRWSF